MRFKGELRRLKSSSRETSSFININRYIKLVVPLVLYYLLSMSHFYQVMGATRCPKIKKHRGIKLTPTNKAKDAFGPGDVLIYSCNSTIEFTQSIKCLDDGRWSDIPHCPDPTNSTCPELGSILHGSYNASGPYKVDTVVAFKCDNEIFNPNLISKQNSTSKKFKDLKNDGNKQSSDGQQYTLPTTTINANLNEVDAILTTTLATPRPLSRSSVNFGPILPNNQPTPSADQMQIRYNLTGHRLLRCLPSSKWNHPLPTCSPILPEPPSNISLMLTSVLLIIVPILIFVAIFQIVMRWRKRQQQRERWKQYFTDYKYRHSKTSITFGMRPQNSSTTIPVTDL